MGVAEVVYGQDEVRSRGERGVRGLSSGASVVKKEDLERVKGG